MAAVRSKNGPDRTVRRLSVCLGAVLATICNELLHALALAGTVQAGIPITMIDARGVPLLRGAASELVREIDAYLHSLN